LREREIEEERAASWVHFPREIGHISQGDFMCEVVVFFVVVGGRTIQIGTIHTVCTTRKKGTFF
jgi:hypothetical protein